MCRIPKVIVVAPSERHLEMRRALSSLEYEIAATVADHRDAEGISADVAVVWEPSEDLIAALRVRGLKIAAIGGDGTGVDMHIALDEAATFKSRIWELFKPR